MEQVAENSQADTTRTLAGSANISAIAILLLGASIVAALAIHLVFLTRYPFVFIDESWYANAAWNWLKTGNNFDTMHAGTLDQFGYESVRWPYIGNLPWVISFASLGLGLFQARLVSYLFGIVLVAATILVGRKAYSLATGTLASLLLVLSEPFTNSSHYARPDIMLAAVIMIVYWLALMAFERENWWVHFLAGLLLGLAVDIHQNALLFMPALAALYLVTYRRHMLRKRGTWLCAAGGLIGSTYYVLLHIAPNPQVYFALFDISLRGPHSVPLLATLNPYNLAKSALHEIGRYHFYENSLQFVMIGASFVYLGIRRSRFDLQLLTFIGVAFLCFVLGAGNKHYLYAILFYPYFMLVVAEAIVSLMRETKTMRMPVLGFVTALAIFLIASSAIRFQRPLIENSDYNYYTIIDSMRASIPTGARVMGRPEWWLGFADYDYRSSLNLTYYKYYNGYTLDQAFEADRPDYLIVDRDQRALLKDESQSQAISGFDIYQLPKQEFETFLSRRGTKVNEVQNYWHGTVEIYNVDWSRPK